MRGRVQREGERKRDSKAEAFLFSPELQDPQVEFTITTGRRKFKWACPMHGIKNGARAYANSMSTADLR